MQFDIGKDVLLHDVGVVGNQGVFLSVAHSCSIKHLKIINKGTMNRIIIHEGCKLNQLTCWMEGNNNLIEIGKRTFIHGMTQLAACDGHSIRIGEGCLFSHDIYVRTTDSHSILNKDGFRINYEEDICIGNSVWIGMQSLFLKGATIPDGCIVGARPTVTRQRLSSNSIVVGAPAKVVKENVYWTFEKNSN